MLPFNVWAQSLWETPVYGHSLSTVISYPIGLPLGLTLVDRQGRHPPDADREHRSGRGRQYPAPLSRSLSSRL